MSPDRDEVPPVLEEVRRRRVGKVVVTYLAVGFATVEAIAVLLPLSTAPEWLGRAILGALVLGFPATIVLSWTYDLTPSGVVRTPDDLRGVPEIPTSHAWLVVTLVSLLVGVAFHVVSG